MNLRVGAVQRLLRAYYRATRIFFLNRPNAVFPSGGLFFAIQIFLPPNEHTFQVGAISRSPSFPPLTTPPGSLYSIRSFLLVHTSHIFHVEVMIQSSAPLSHRDLW